MLPLHTTLPVFHAVVTTSSVHGVMGQKTRIG